MSDGRVLVVDDTLAMAQTISDYLRAHGFDAEVATSGRDAVARFKSVPADVVLADLRMKEMDGMDLIAEIRTIYNNYDFDTEILAASIRTVNHVKQAALIGADVVTVPPATLRALVKHPLTDKGLEAFLADWAKTGQKIA